MAKKKEINPESGKRVKELLKEHKKTQEWLSEQLYCTVQHLSFIVTGKKRLTEENARIIADLFPPVRFEWLMGYDDCKTALDYEFELTVKNENEMIDKKYGHILAAKNNQSTACEIIREMGYKFRKQNDKISGSQAECKENLAFVQRNLHIFNYFWDIDDIQKALDNKIDKLFPHRMRPYARIPKDTDVDDDRKKAIINNSPNRISFLSEIYDSATNLEIEKRKSCDTEYIFLDKDSKPITTCTFSEYENFVNELYEITNLLVLGFIERQKNRKQECISCKSKKED